MIYKKPWTNDVHEMGLILHYIRAMTMNDWLSVASVRTREPSFVEISQW